MRTVCFVDPQHFCGDAEPVGIKVGERHKLGAVGVGAAQVPSEGPYTAAPNPDNSEAYLHHLRSTPRVTDVMGSLDKKTVPDIAVSLRERRDRGSGAYSDRNHKPAITGEFPLL